MLNSIQQALKGYEGVIYFYNYDDLDELDIGSYDLASYEFCIELEK